MNGVIHTIAICFIYSAIWFVPIGINFDRRKRKLPAYWHIFFITLVVEILLVYLLLVSVSYLSNHIAYAYIPPVLASFVAGMFYFKVAKKLDDRHS